jgi:hypothetical protein
MRKLLLHLFIGLCLAHAMAGRAFADVCIVVDEAHDTFSPGDRTAAALLLARQFELAGEHVLPDGCPTPYALSHIMLGNTIVVTVSGPRGRREGTALGMDDLPALYNQIVRSLISGRPMTGFNVVDRTNVTAAQTVVERVPGDSLWYARLGYGGVFGDRFYGGPSMGLGFRYELDRLGVDVAFFNFQTRTSDPYTTYASSNGAFAGSLLKLEGLYFLQPHANKSAYVGGGMSWGGADFGSGWHGSGLQGELTAGYELPRASTLRMFVQADATLPFYNATSVGYPVDFRRGGPITTSRRYAPSIVVSMGFGWQRDQHGRP